jgi:hypothetical protein
LILLDDICKISCAVRAVAAETFVETIDRGTHKDGNEAATFDVGRKA